MKRKLNESVAGSVKIDVVSLVHDYPELQGNIDKLAKQIEDTTGASVSQDESDDTIYMVIDGTTQDDIIDIFSEDYYIDDIDSYFAYDDNFSSDAIKDDNFSLDAIKDDNPDFDVDDAAAAQAYAEEDMMDEDMGFDDEGEWLEEWDDEEYDDSLDAMIPDYDDVEIDVVEDDDDDDDDIYSDEYESTDDEYSDEDELNDSSFDECMEDEDFECYESERRAFKRRRAMNEKKNGCCPPKKGRMLNLSESLKMMKNGVTVKDIVRSAKQVSLNESVINDAINKAKNEHPKKDINEKRATLAALKKALGEDKFNTIVKALKEGKKTLYTKKSINGKNLTEYSSKELLDILNMVKEQRETLVKSYKSLNESATRSTKKELRDAIENKERLMDLLDEELTYRLTVKKMLKEQEAVNEDDANPLEPLSVDPNDSGESTEGDSEETPAEDDSEGDSEETTEDPEEDEEVELSRVVITVANQEAADELKDAMVNAGIPEDAIEFETEGDEKAEGDSEDGDADAESEESTDDAEGDSEESTEETPAKSNESIHYNKFKKLLEDEETDTPAEDDSEAEGDAEDDSEAEDGDAEATGEVKVVLTNTDYINDLADVLNNEYGITKEEFEEMIGGTIVDEESSDDAEDSDSEGSDDSEESKEDKPSTNGDDAVDAMSQEELDKLFGEN